jgi:predicted nuclease of predicted toxin-antitoxin system
MLLLHQGLPRSTSLYLRQKGIEAVHTGEIGLASADDARILDYARLYEKIVVTLHADFHRILAISRATRPSVIRIRIEGLRAEPLAELLLNVVDQSRDDLEQGTLVTVTPVGVRFRRLPIAAPIKS